MTDSELRELDSWIAEHVMGEMVSFGCIVYLRQLPNGEPEEVQGAPIPHYTASQADAFAVLKKCYEYDRNSCLASLHNFLMRKDHDGSLTPLQICLFAKNLKSK